MSLGALFLALLGSAERVEAEALTTLLDMAPGAPALHPFAFNPALPMKTTSDAAYIAAGLEPSRRLQTRSSDGVEQDVATRQLTTLGVGWVGRVGGDMRAALDSQVTLVTGAEGRESGRSENMYSSRHLGARLALSLASGLSAGFLLQATYFDVPTLRFQDGVASDTRGYVFGAGAGILWGDKPEKSLGLFHLPSQRGSAEAEGESRILARPSISGFDLAMPWSEATTLGVSARTFKRDEGADADPGRAEEGGVGKSAEASAGLRIRLTAPNFWRVAATREALDVSAGPAFATRFKAMIGRVQEGVESWLGMSARWGFEMEEAQGNSVKRLLPASDLTYLAGLSFKL